MLDKTYKRKENVVTREIAGETLIVPVHGKLADMQRIFALDPVAAFVWRHLDGKTDAARICSRVVERFDVGLETAEKDVLEFLDELLETGLIHM